MGYTIFMDENGDAQGNYTLLAINTKHDVKGMKFEGESYILTSSSLILTL